MEDLFCLVLIQTHWLIKHFNYLKSLSKHPLAWSSFIFPWWHSRLGTKTFLKFWDILKPWFSSPGLQKDPGCWLYPLGPHPLSPVLLTLETAGCRNWQAHECGPHIRNQSILKHHQNLLETQILRLCHPRPTESETRGGGTAICVLTSPPRGPDAHSFENRFNSCDLWDVSGQSEKLLCSPFSPAFSES